MNIVPSTPRSSKASSPQLITWLRKRTCGLVYGIRTDDGVVPSSTTLTELRDKINLKRGLPGLRNADYEEHFRSDATYYFWGGHRTDQPEVICEIDIDVLKAQGRGTTEGAWDFARHLQKTFANLYCEPSTGGKGVHGIGVFKKGTLGPVQVRLLLRRLERWLRDEATRVSADIELVEVTGLPPILHWHRGDLSFVNPGVWAKIPRDARREAEIMGTYCFTTHQLSHLELSVNPEPEDLPTSDGYISPLEREIAEILKMRSANRGYTTCDPLATALNELQQGVSPACPQLVAALEEVENGAVVGAVVADVPTKAMAAAPRKLKESHAKRSPSERTQQFELSKQSSYGSGKFINPAFISVFAEAVEESGGFTGMKTGKRRRIHSTHIGLVLTLLHHCTRKVYADGTMPGDRIMGLWKCLYDEDVVQYAPNYEIFKSVRNRLSDMGLLEVEDWCYLPPQDCGELHLEGRASKWRLSSRLMSALDALLTEKIGDPTGSMHSITPLGGEMVHTLFQRERLLMPQGRPVNRLELLSRLQNVQDAAERTARCYAG